MLDSTHKLAFIGENELVQALISGLIKQGMVRQNIMLQSSDERARSLSARRHHIRTTRKITNAVGFADVIILAESPQRVPEVCIQINDEMEALQRQVLIISVAQGIRHTDLQSWLFGAKRLISAIPNIPSAICEGLTGLFAATDCPANDQQYAEQIMQSLGQTVWLDDEDKMPALAATSASSPAYFILFMEAMQKAAVEQGLDPNIAKTSVLQSALGAVNMAVRSTESLANLREKATPQQGTTNSALASFEKGQIDSLVANAMLSAASKMEELYSQHSTHLH